MQRLIAIRMINQAAEHFMKTMLKPRRFDKYNIKIFKPKLQVAWKKLNREIQSDYVEDYIYWNFRFLYLELEQLIEDIDNFQEQHFARAIILLSEWSKELAAKYIDKECRSFIYKKEPIEEEKDDE